MNQNLKYHIHKDYIHLIHLIFNKNKVKNILIIKMAVIKVKNLIINLKSNPILMHINIKIWINIKAFIIILVRLNNNEKKLKLSRKLIAQNKSLWKIERN